MIKVPTFKFALTEGLPSKFLPTLATTKATGWDVCAAEALEVRAGEYVKIPLGFRVLPPDGWWLELRPRSSTFGKKNVHALYGVIDEDYEGQVLFAGQYLPYRNIKLDGTVSFAPPWNVAFGEAIGQVIPVRRQNMSVLELTNEELDAEYAKRAASRGTGGFGSTGK